MNEPTKKVNMIPMISKIIVLNFKPFIFLNRLNSSQNNKDGADKAIKMMLQFIRIITTDSKISNK